MVKVCGVNLTNTNANNQKAFATPYQMGSTKVVRPSTNRNVVRNDSYLMAA